MNARRITAINNIAHRTLSRQLALKAKPPEADPATPAGWAHLKTLLREVGLSHHNIVGMLVHYTRTDGIKDALATNPGPPTV